MADDVSGAASGERSDGGATGRERWSRRAAGLRAAAWLTGCGAVSMLPVRAVDADERSEASEPLPGAATAANAMAATVHPAATEAARDALAAGGNAVDAAVTAALMLGVVDGHNSGIGGGCLILVRTPDGEIHALDGRETAPAAASRDMFARDAREGGDASRTGPLAVATPGALAAYDRLLNRFGRRSLADALRPAAEVAENGFAIDANYSTKLADAAAELRKFAESRRILLKSDGSPYATGERLRQPDLASVYRAIAEQGADWFYRGPFARRVEAWMREHGGLLTAADFAAYRPKWRRPVVVRYRGCQVSGFPPPSSGGLHVGQMLQMLETLDGERLGREDSVERIHGTAEAMKAAFADRARWLGDSDFVDVPRGLLDPDYARRLAAQIDFERAREAVGPGEPPKATTHLFEKHTTHLTAADRDGWWAAITATVNTTFGSKAIVPGTGVVLNNEMDDFAVAPGVPNAFGLAGAEANAIAPGKRPLSSMSPTIVERSGKPFFTVGAAGGPTIISQVLLAILRVIDDGRSLDQALAAGRWHHQGRPDRLRIEKRLATPDVVAGLERRGHRLELVERIGVSQGIAWDERSARFLGVSDPRVPGAAGGR